MHIHKQGTLYLINEKILIEIELKIKNYQNLDQHYPRLIINNSLEISI